MSEGNCDFRFTICDCRQGVLVICIFMVASVCANAATSSNLTEGMRLFEAGNLPEAKKEFLTELKMRSNSAEARFYLGQIAFGEKHYDEAIREFELASKANPTNIAYLLWLARSYGRQAREVNALSGARLARKSKATLESAVALNPDNLDARVGLVTFYSEAPGVVGGSIPKAIAEAEEIKKRNPYRGNIVLGDVYRDNKEDALAERCYRAAATINTNSLEPYFRLGVLYIRFARFENAFATCEKILASTAEERVIALHMLGEACLRSGQRLDHGIEAISKYLNNPRHKGMPSHASAHVIRGGLYEKSGKIDLARDDYRTALKLQPGHKAAQDALKRVQ
jgi:tetratricopeptide (TPR) repeat protein